MMLPLGLSYDHRLIDGANAARFMVDLVAAFEQFSEKLHARRSNASGFIWNERTTVKATKTELVVLGAGPGGYTAAFYAAARGKKVVTGGDGGPPGRRLPEPGMHPIEGSSPCGEADLGGRRIGIPRHLFRETQARPHQDAGVERIDSSKTLERGQRRGGTSWSGSAVWKRIFRGLQDTSRRDLQRDSSFSRFEQAIIATGSRAAMPAAFDLGNKRVMTSTEALEIEEIPKKLLIVGGGYIGMELGTVYATLGSEHCGCGGARVDSHRRRP